MSQEKYIPLNNEIEAVVKANSTYNPLIIKPGLLSIGDMGLEYRAESGQGYIQIPWSEVKLIRVQLFFGGRYVRGIFVDTNDKETFEFIISDGKHALKSMRKFLPREKFKAAGSNFAGLFKRKN